MLFYENLGEIIFHWHERFDVDELLILSGFVSAEPISKLQYLPFKCTVIYGMYESEGISEKFNTTLNKFNLDIPNLNVLYSVFSVHSKCYVWKKNSKIVTALMGSANFTVNGLLTPYREILTEVTFDTFEVLENYLNIVLENCIPCYDNSIKTKKKSQIMHAEFINENC